MTGLKPMSTMGEQNSNKLSEEKPRPPPADRQICFLHKRRSHKERRIAPQQARARTRPESLGKKGDLPN